MSTFHKIAVNKQQYDLKQAYIRRHWLPNREGTHVSGEDRRYKPASGIYNTQYLFVRAE